MDALESFGHDRFHARQTHTLCRPVARGALAVIGPRDDDQRLLARHVGLNRLPHAHHLTFRFHAGQRTLLCGTVLVADHLVRQGGDSRRWRAAR